MLNRFEFTLPEKIEHVVLKQFDEWKKEDRIGRLWNKDAALWTGDDEQRWLGWLDIVSEELGALEKYRDFAEEVAETGFSDIVLCGMGGSSLCPEVLAETFDKENFHVLDSTVPGYIRSIEERINAGKTLFIVSSKSGSTLETNIFRQYFYQKVSDAVGEDAAGEHFVAVTDPGSKLEKIADRDNFRKVFYGEPDVGGRFSALSAFGLAPAAAMQLDVRKLLLGAELMMNACKSHLPAENPGAALGLILGVSHRLGRDKLTIFTSPEIYDLGAWLEQLIAESTGKEGVAIIPVDREEILEPEEYGDDRIFVYLQLRDSFDKDRAERIGRLVLAGQPLLKIELSGKYSLGQEFFRWEFATAVAGAVMNINPFNQPDVEAAKIEAKKITGEYEQTGRLPGEEPFYTEDGIRLFTDRANLERLEEILGDREKTLENYLRTHLSRLSEDDYFALLAYLEMDEENEVLLQQIRHSVLRTHNVATALGFGPRFLHSTGQAYKGGGANGVFLQIAADDAEDLAIPDQKYSFGVVKAAQARGDFQVLLDRGRRALRVQLTAETRAGLEKIAAAVSDKKN